MRTLRAFVAASMSVFGTFGCADLPTIGLGVCGNGVTEPTHGEDCDGAGKEGTTCAAPGSAHECRYLCAAQAVCPSGLSCGQDGVCRGPAARWAPESATTIRTAEPSIDVAIADADGDGRGEVFAQSPRSIVVHYDTTSAAPTSLSVARSELLQVIGPVADLSGDGLADAVVPTGLGYFVSLGDPSRTERATAYGALRLPEGVSQAHALSAEILPDEPGSEVLVLAVAPGPNAPPTPGLVYVAGSGAYSFIATLPDMPDHLAGPPKPGRFNEDSRTTPCDELVLAYRGSAVLDLLVPCTTDHGTAVLAVDAQVTEVRLPKGATVAGPVEIEDLDHDGHQDLALVAERGGVYEIDVAYGRGDGTFDSVLRSGATTAPDGALGVAVVVGKDLPLVVRDLDGDARPDWVDASGVYFARADAPVVAAHNSGAAWTSAVVGRFDGDSLFDVAVGSNLASGLAVYLNAGDGTLTEFSLATRGGTSMLGTGDFDGDRITDIVAANTARVNESDSSPDTLSIAFGSPFGAPSPAKDVGEFYRIHELAAGRVAAGDVPVVDGADDLGALVEGEDGSLAYVVLLGKGDRELRAPYALTRTDVTAQTVVGYVPVRFAVGDVDADGRPDVVSLAGRIDGVPELSIASAPMYGRASIRLTDTTFSPPLESGFDWLNVLFGLVNLDGAPGDEVILLGPSTDGSGHKVAVAHADGANGARTFVLGPETSVEESFTRTEAARPDASVPNGRLRVADIDADGVQDVLVLGERAGQGELLVYFNDGTGELGTPVRVPGADSLDVRDFAVTEADGDVGEEIALLTTSGVYVVNASKRELTLGPAQLSGQASSSVPASLIDTGDVDGDGVQDLALAGPDGIEVHLGISSNPKDTR